jgi:2,3-bisphosphoglycerate-independent phosphoglycerate mutase
MSKKPVVLIIRDGWGINPGGKAKAAENGGCDAAGEHAIS